MKLIDFFFNSLIVLTRWVKPCTGYAYEIEIPKELQEKEK